MIRWLAFYWAAGRGGNGCGMNTSWVMTVLTCLQVAVSVAMVWLLGIASLFLVRKQVADMAATLETEGKSTFTRRPSFTL